MLAIACPPKVHNGCMTNWQASKTAATVAVAVRVGMSGPTKAVKLPTIIAQAWGLSGCTIKPAIKPGAVAPAFPCPNRKFATFHANQMIYIAEIYFSAANTAGAASASSISPKPMGQMINCFPSATPATNGKAARKPKRAPVASNAIFAGPGVPTCDAAKIARGRMVMLMRVTFTGKREKEKGTGVSADP